MIKSFRHKGIERFFVSGSKVGIQAQQEKRLRLILGRLNASRKPEDMNLPGLRLHQLQGRLRGYWAVDVTGNWRLIFRFEDDGVFDVDLIDYH
jgi:proteic killer suppression protein